MFAYSLLFLLAPLSLLSLLSLVSAATPTSFCKCTCFSNSTIIPLDAPRSNSPPSNRVLLPRTPSPPWPELFARDPEDDGDEKKDDDDGAGKGGKEKEEDRKEFRAGNCNDCNRQYCIDAHLPICRDAGVEDVVATCFQRDSRKDEAVVFIFIFATAGLLGWAAMKPWVGKWVESARERGRYIPVPNRGDT